MNRFKLLTQRATGKWLIPFITAGHPGKDFTVSIMHDLVSSGADAIELGMPFSDPMADGSVIQESSEKAIKNGVGLTDVLGYVKQFRQDNIDTPVVLMGYLNPIECMGYREFVSSASEAGVDAVLIVDSPPEESGQLMSYLKNKHMDQIFLIAPTTTDDRRQYILQNASGFIYYVALKGVTGSSELNMKLIENHLNQLSSEAKLPVAIGFGIKDAVSARKLAQYADAVVIGSALVEKLAVCKTRAELKECINAFILPIREALNSL